MQMPSQRGRCVRDLRPTGSSPPSSTPLLRLPPPLPSKAKRIGRVRLGAASGFVVILPAKEALLLPPLLLPPLLLLPPWTQAQRAL
jgi:hypothetical protein